MQPTAALVMGTVEADPLYPLTTPDRPNTRPVAGAVVEALHDGNVVAATTTDDAGRYELRVHPGTYLIRARAEGLYSKEPGKAVTISPGETVSVRFILDTGIRCRSHQPATYPMPMGHPRYDQSPAPTASKITVPLTCHQQRRRAVNHSHDDLRATERPQPAPDKEEVPGFKSR